MSELQGPKGQDSLAQGLYLFSVLSQYFLVVGAVGKASRIAFAPKGLQDSAQGFNPGNRPPRSDAP